MLALSGWTPDVPLLDPMCGSGTILCEAAQIAANRAPGIGRAFGFEKLLNFDAQTWDTLRNTAYASENNSIKTNIYGSDLRGDALELARANLEELDLAGKVTLKQANVFEMPPPAPSGIIVTNPPYGVRMEERDDLAAFYPKLGDALKKISAAGRRTFCRRTCNSPSVSALRRQSARRCSTARWNAGCLNTSWYPAACGA